MSKSSNFLVKLSQSHLPRPTQRSRHYDYRYNVCFRNAGELEYHFGVHFDGKVNSFSIKPVPGEPIW